MRILRFCLVILKGLNPMNPRLSLTWKQAWKESSNA
jgi:hypothetical protein